MNEPLRVAVAGAGYFARFHYDAWSRMPDVSLVAACDRDPNRALEVCAKFAIPEWFTGLEDMLDRTQPDLLDIVLPPASHAAAIRAACDRRIDAVCQKPFCGDLQTAKRMTGEADAAGIRLAVHENFRFQPWYREISKQLRQGRLGEPYGVLFRLRPGDGQGPEAYLSRQPYFQDMNRFLIHETGIHFVDTFRFLLGDVDAVAADLRRLNPAIAGEDAGVVQFRFASGARGVFDGNRLADHAAENRRFTMGEMWLDGSLGTLRLDGYGRIFFRAHGHDDEERVEYSLPLSGFGGDSVLSTQQHVVDHLQRGAALETAAKDYLANLVIEEAIYLSDERGCWVSPDEVAVQGAPPIRQR